MKTIFTLLTLIGTVFCFGQSNFDMAAYKTYLETNKNLSKESLFARYPQMGTYYTGDDGPYDIKQACYYDSVIQKLHLTDDELKLLKTNHFVVTERYSNWSLLGSMEQIYNLDLPIMVTTDVMLHALHNSYDNMLKSIEMVYLEQNLEKVLSKMHAQFKLDAPTYNAVPALKHVVCDAEKFLIVARRLLDTTMVLSPTYCRSNEIEELLGYIYDEKMVHTPVFSYSARPIDFSQFKPRGHYTYGQESYFRSMIWLSFIDIYLTKPEQDRTFEPRDIKRMAMVSAMINELLFHSDADLELNENDEIIKFFVGESDNLTPQEFKEVMGELSIDHIEDLDNDSTLELLQKTLMSQEAYGQKILSGIIMTEPLSPDPAPLAISYKLFGQRFVIDSYVLHNVSYDQIVYQNKKVMRMMPDPLDVMFCLGNNNAIHLLDQELTKYPYSSSIDAMRYLFDSYDDGYWSASLYNTWLKSIKELSTAENNSHIPFFMKTVAWQHEKLNSQLSSWSQLRHDNILYAKQSYTGGVGCSYPHGYVEPYPGFFLTLKMFASDAANFMSKEKFNTDIYEKYWNRFAGITDTLLGITLAEVNGEAFTHDQEMFLKQALRIVQHGVCGGPPIYDGWLSKLFWRPDMAAEDDFTVADVHTQPTDEGGRMVGKVLHTGVGRFNMGIFIAPSPSNRYKPTLFCGPAMSYYQFITTNFERKNDEEWKEMLLKDQAPDRPAFTKSYLANNGGGSSEPSILLKGILFTDSAYSVGSSLGIEPATTGDKIKVWYDGFNIVMDGLESGKEKHLALFDISGREILATTLKSLSLPYKQNAKNVYFYRLSQDGRIYTGKLHINR